MNELGIYIHIPFCKQKCYYCDFISFANKEEYIKKYIQALLKEIVEVSKEYNNMQKENKKEITTIYIGGGTPSFIDEKYIEEILNKIKQEFKMSKDVEITIEVNPGTADEDKLKKYNQIGINRISIGLQSTKNEILKQIGRIHTYEQFLETYNLSRKNNIKNINVDLMLGLPNQTIEDLNESVEKVIKLNPEHISIYSLIIEENTVIEKQIQEGKIELPTEEIERQMYWNVKNRLEKENYIHYEISNFSKKDQQSKHNLNCWNQEEYIGLGLAAHSYINNKRYCNTDNIKEYIENIENNNYENNRQICEIQNEEEKMKEYMLLGLRKIDGVNIQKFKNKFSKNPIYVFRKELEKLVNEELIQIDLNNIQLTRKGLDFANIVWEEFV